MGNSYLDVGFVTRLRFIFIFIVASFSCVSGAFAQTTDLSFDHITIEEGLSQSTVYAITQDASGVMWFGTRDGLNKYDSRKVTAYHHQPDEPTSISDNTIYSLYSDKKGRLWIGTSRGLNLYRPRTDNFISAVSREGDLTSLSHSTVTAVFEDRYGHIWVGTRHGLNLLIPGDSLKFFRFIHSETDKNSIVNNDVRSIYEDTRGNLWIGTSQGLSKLQFRDQQHYRFHSYQVIAASENPKDNWINAVIEDHQERLVVATEKSGLKLFDPASEKFSSLSWINEPDASPEAIRTLLKEKNGDYWVGTIGGLYFVNSDQKKITRLKNSPDDPLSISDNSVRALYKDRDGSIWVGTFHGGINIYSSLSRQFHQVSEQSKKPFKIASALALDTGANLWIGTEGSGLFFHDRTTGKIKRFRHKKTDRYSLSHNNVKCILPVRDGLWVGTIKGLNYFDLKKKQFRQYHQELPSDVIYDLAADSQGAIWIATYRGGLCRYDPRTKTLETFTRNPTDPTSLSSEGVISIFIDSKQRLWAGTLLGLNLMEAPGKFKRYVADGARATTISGNYILCIFEDRQNRLWVGTRDKGLNLLLPDEQSFKRFSTEDGLPGNTIHGIQEDENGYLWISTENGLAKFDPRVFSSRNYDKNDGLVCKEFNHNSYCKDQSGNMYFGGYNGVVVFKPETIVENNIVPPLRFTALKLFDKEVKAGADNDLLKEDINFADRLVFRHDQNIFTVEFAALNYINARKNLFAYRLEGFEKNWNITRDPSATYMNLRPGNYTLMVKGANNDGVWNEVPILLKLKVLPPPWKSWWAYTIYVSIFLSLLYAWSRFNKKRVRLEHDLALEHLEKKKQEELHQTKLNFFTNIVHEIRTPLTLMTSPVDKMLEQFPDDVFLNKELALVKSNTDRLQRLLNQLLDFHKQETGNVRLRVKEGNIVEFLDEIQLSFQEYAQSRKVTFDFYAEKPIIKLWYDREELSKVFCNLILNAFKFTPGGGRIGISIAQEFQTTDTENYSVRITIADNGLGISPQHLEKIFHRFYQAENSGINEAGFGIGLALTKGIIDLHHGTITVESREATPDDTGFTKFTIVMPAGQTHFDKAQINTEMVEGTYLYTDKELDRGVNEPVPAKTAAGAERPLILLVEDNDEIRAYLRDTLLEYYEVVESRHGLEALGIALEQLPDFVISDVMMPKMNGLELVQKLKTDERTSHIPVILLTARGTLNHQVEGLETGADDYLSKPFNVQLLLIKIKNQLLVRERLKEKYSRIVTLQPQHEEVQNPDDKFLQRLMRILEDNIIDSDFNVTKLVREIGMSRPVLFRKTKMLTGLSVIDLIRNVRLKKAEMLLKQKKLSISEVAFTVGFSDPKYFSKSFRNQFGKSPSQYLEELN
ncbi:MAG: hybrid sensor histidine kinase/response regulator transcription factor [Bacteroidota bacterium]